MENYIIENDLLKKIKKLDTNLYNEFESKLEIDINLTRKLVSNQANKTQPSYRWFKFKEGFSKDLVNYYIDKYNNTNNIFDPFAGSGTTLFAASEKGIESQGIELLPIGCEIINSRKILQCNFKDSDFQRLKYYVREKPWINVTQKHKFSEVRITKYAYPDDTKILIEKYLHLINTESTNLFFILRFALLCILESISYTRKDGQYLRWDHRSKRNQGKGNFNKGKILAFNDAIVEKLNEIIQDTFDPIELSVFDRIEQKKDKANISLICGSCLEELPKIYSNQFDLIITSPPYANRYDYTRTYALELAMLGSTTEEFLKMRQTMLSCTVENKEKDLLEINDKWSNVISILKEQELLLTIIEYLEYKKKNKTLNNNGIPRMIKGYFFEMACIIFELYRTLKNDGSVIMVNDNVRYAGISIPVDLILSQIAKKIGFTIDKISVLTQGKGNSSQQMGEYGRKKLRKCVYIWRKI